MGRANAVMVVLAMLGLAGACTGSDPPSSPGSDVRRGVIVHYHEGPQIAHPDTVEAGVPFTVVVTTFGNGCYRSEHTRVSRPAAHQRVIEPYDAVQLRTACPDLLREIDHAAELIVPEPGEAELVFVGLHEPADTVVRFRRTVVAETPSSVEGARRMRAPVSRSDGPAPDIFQ